MNAMIKLLLLVIMGVNLSSCFKVETQDVNDNAPTGNVSEFANYTTINVKMASDKNERVSIFFNEPYKDGALSNAYLEAYLGGNQPSVNVKLQVPKHVDSLMVIKGDKIMRFDVADIVIDDFAKSRSYTKGKFPDNFREIADIVNNVYFPETRHNLKGEELYKCTDLTIKGEGLSTKANVSITYLSDGFFSGTGMYGKLWAYSYPKSKRDNGELTLDDCTFYGLEDGKVTEVKYSDISQVKSGSVLGENEKPIFWSKTEEANVDKGVYTCVKLGEFEKGLCVGFVFKGDEERCQFTTPELNVSEGNYKYIGHTVKYNDGYFPIEKHVSSGFIYNIDDELGDIEEGESYNILGMENRTPNHRAYDGDYNDILCYLYSNPIKMEPEEELENPGSLGAYNAYTREKGLYLFEDNYPYKNDFDFNDVVISYEILDYFNTPNHKKKVTACCLAVGAGRTNIFGFTENGKPKELIKQITGNINNSDFVDSVKYGEIYKATYYGDIKPYLYNGSNYITGDNFNSGDYPYVLVIPSTGNIDDEFCWCKEQVSIDDAYKFKSPRANNWYITPQDRKLVVKR